MTDDKKEPILNPSLVALRKAARAVTDKAEKYKLPKPLADAIAEMEEILNRERGRPSGISDETRETIRQLIAGGASKAAISRQLKIPATTVARIVQQLAQESDH